MLLLLHNFAWVHPVGRPDDGEGEGEGKGGHPLLPLHLPALPLLHPSCLLDLPPYIQVPRFRLQVISDPVHNKFCDSAAFSWAPSHWQW